MKKIYFAFICAICALTLFSCQKEDNTPEEVIPDGYTQLTLSAVSDETKTTLDGTAVKWAAGDQIKVYCSDESAYDFELVGEGGSATGDFTGLVPSGKTALYAVYPKDLYSSVSSSTVNVTIPAAQEGTFGKGNIAVAKVDGEHNMAFKNVNAFVGFTVGADITKVVVSSVGGENLSGTLAVDCSGETPAAGALSDGGSSITVTFPESTGGTYYVAIAPGITHSKGLLLTWYNGTTVTGTYWLNKAITTVANNVYDMETVSADGHYYVSVDGAGKKNGMNAANAWSASQFWSKLHPGGTDAAMDNAKLANINGATFHLAAGTYNWGIGAAINIDAGETISFTIKGESGTIFTGDDNDDDTGDHRILILDGNMSIVFDGITFTKGLTKGSSEARFGGGVLIKSGSHSFVDCTFTHNSAETSGKNKGYGGAIRFDSTGNMTLTGTTFSYNTATGDSGALSLSAGTTIITDCSFSNNSAPSGGAIDCFGSSKLSIGDSNFSYNTASSAGGALAMEEDATCSITTTQFDHNSANTGGAISISGGGDLKIKRSYYYRNDAHTGGAVYTVKADGKFATVFVDECSFENNWISGRFGCIFNMNGFAKFCMYNCSAKDSYTKSTESDYLKGLNPSWIAVDPDGGEGCVSFGNCSIIGDTWDGNNDAALSDGTALIAVWGSQTNYFTNCIIAPETNSGIAAIKGNSGSEKIDLYYTHYSSVDGIGTNTNSGGNTTSRKKSDFSGNYWSSGHCWKWNGKIGEDTPALATKKNVYDRINGICSDFVSWSDTDFVKDQLGSSRGANDDDPWWPGAYQN